MKSVYFTNGVNEKRVPVDSEAPSGWKRGRLKKPITTADKIWIHNESDEKFIDKNMEIPKGWIRGRLKSNLNLEQSVITRKSRYFRWYTNNHTEKLIADDEDVPTGFVLGRLPAKQSARIKCSKSHKGKHHTEETRAKMKGHNHNNRQKAHHTILEMYGSFEAYYGALISKGIKTKRKNNTFNASKSEEQYYKKLCQGHDKSDIYRNYKCERYPFYCDFYIKSEDLFIELNAHWTHGGKPYDPDDKECQEQLAKWKEKAKTSKFYENAIKTWTERDVKKLQKAKENNLNYKVIY